MQNCKLSSLKKLHCRNCINLRDKNLISLLKYANDLNILDIYNCEKITNYLVNYAIKVTKIRLNKVMLNIGIVSTKINIYEIEEISPLLRLLNTDNVLFTKEFTL